MSAQFCPHCGKPIIALGATFCAFCGRPLGAQPLPEGAFPPGMVAVPPIPAPPEGPPPAPPMPPAYGAPMAYPPPGYVQPTYSPPGYVQPAYPPPGYAPAGYAPAVPAGYAPGMRMTPAFSGTRATWIAIAVVVASVVFVFLNFYGEPIVLRLSRAYFSAGEGLVLVVPAAFWLGLTRLPQVSMGRAWAEAIGINVTLSLVIEVIEIVVSSRIYGYNPLIFLTRDLIETSIIALIASVIGQGLAAAFASWSAVRGSVIVGRSGTGALWWAIGGVMAANFVFFALNFWSAYFRMIYLLRIWGMLPVMPVAILIVWYASWSTLRLLRQRAAAPGVPVAPGVPGVWQQR